jgi:hypothetical protein
MKVVKKDGEYIIYQKRNGRHAVKNRKGKTLVQGDDKAQILLAAGLIAQPKPKAEAPAEEAPAEA